MRDLGTMDMVVGCGEMAIGDIYLDGECVDE